MTKPKKSLWFLIMTIKKSLLLPLGFALLSIPTYTFAQSANQSSAIDPTMNSILTNAGLSHLSDADKVKVINLLRLAMNSNTAAGCPSSSSRAIESEIDGEFEGWNGETIFKLSNGQIWQQDEYDYEYEYAYRPDVLIFRDGSYWKMKVEDMDETIKVKCIS